MDKKKSVPIRKEIDPQYTWKLEDIFVTDEAWEVEFTEVKKIIPSIEKYKGNLSLSADHLFEALQLNDEISLRVEKLYTYAHMRFDQDTANSFYQGLNDRITTLYTQASSQMSFMTPEILSAEEKISSFLEHRKLKLYRHYLEKVFKVKEHVLSGTEEALLAGAAEVMRASSNTYSILNNADLSFSPIKDEDGDEIEVSHGRYSTLLQSTDPRVRKDAYNSVYNSYDKFRNTIASTLSSTVKKNNFIAKTRNFKSARASALTANHIPEVVYDQLINTVNNNLSLFYRYLELKKRMLKLSTMHTYDLSTPILPDFKFKVTYKEAQEILLSAFEPYGEEYISTLKKAYKDRWVDVYENKGKRSGAYSSGSYATNPYILMNWQDNINNLFTLAHEFGHSLHSYYTRQKQSYVYGDYSIFVAEVASTCNEALLHHHLMQSTTDKKKQLYLLNHYLDGFRGTVFRQTMFAEFENLIHQKAQEGIALTADWLSEQYKKLNHKHFAKAVELDEKGGIEWARIPHFYYNFYVYQYATGYSAAAALSKLILTEGKPAVDRYLDFLSAGSSDYPIEVLKKAGVDMTTSTPIEQALQVFAETIEQTEKIFQEIDGL